MAALGKAYTDLLEQLEAAERQWHFAKAQAKKWDAEVRRLSHELVQEIERCKDAG